VMRFLVVRHSPFEEIALSTQRDHCTLSQSGRGLQGGRKETYSP
jgi:hypothetical protein